MMSSLFGQQMQIHQNNIAKKSKFNTVVKLLDGKKNKGKLTGYTDSTLTLSFNKVNKDSLNYGKKHFHFKEIDNIKLVREFRGIGLYIGIPAGIFWGSMAGIIYSQGGIDHYGSSPPPKASEVLIGAASGAIVGGLIGTGIEFATRRKYVFKINGDYDSFSLHLQSLILMVLDEPVIPGFEK
jgi:hypothetical protein